MLKVKQKEINYYIQFSKLIASMFIVFLHVKFPGNLGNFINCLSRFAVPLFFAISGYYSYQINCDKILKRIFKFLKLNIIATTIYAFWECIYIKYIINESIFSYLVKTLTLNNISKSVFINTNVFSDHLWYLSAIIVCYIVLWIYTRLFIKKIINYHPLYMISICLLIFQIIISLNFVSVNINIHYLSYRNALLTGIPMFCLGIFINEYKSKIIKNLNLNTKKLIILIVLGILLSLLQWFGIAKSETPIGSIIEVICLILLLTSLPPIIIKSKYNIAAIIGNISLIIYIIHPLLDSIITRLTDKILIFSFFKNAVYLYPLAIFNLSLICGILYSILFYKNKF